MSTCHLGEHFDIHGGGPDLVFPHHENEIAQSEAATGKHYVNLWMHAGAVRVDNEKMSKSLGNFFTIREVLGKYHPEVIRFFLVSSHYRSPINYSEENLVEAKAGLERFYAALRGVEDATLVDKSALKQSAYYQRFIEAMNDDFNTREAIAVLYDMVRDLNNAQRTDDQATVAQIASQLKSLGAVLGILQDDPEHYFQGVGSDDELTAQSIEAFIQQRLQARKDKNFALADKIRDDLKEKGVILEDTREGTSWKRD
jgi:cysteinyl-tRNA synthetase